MSELKLRLKRDIQVVGIEMLVMHGAIAIGAVKWLGL
jgi:hypothetical protein